MLKSKSRNRPLLCQMRTAKRQKSLDASLSAASPLFSKKHFSKVLLLLVPKRNSAFATSAAATTMSLFYPLF